MDLIDRTCLVENLLSLSLSLNPTHVQDVLLQQQQRPLLHPLDPTLPGSYHHDSYPLLSIKLISSENVFFFKKKINGVSGKLKIGFKIFSYLSFWS